MPFEVRVDIHAEYPVITLKDADTGIEAEIYAFGGLLNALSIPVKNTRSNVVDGFISPAEAKKNITNGFKSAKLSPFVCRMYEGKFRLRENTYQVNKHYLGEHAIHGLIYDAVYTIVHSEKTDTYAAVTMEYQYAGTDKGYPFPYHTTLDWKLETGNKLTVTTTVVHSNQQSIPFADGWHPYFTLGGRVDDWLLQFDSITQLVYNNDLLPTGEMMADSRFLKGSSLQNISLDNSFELEAAGKCVLSNHLLRLTIEPDNSYPILQIYTPDHRKSIAIENLSGAPDNFNNGIGLILLPSGKPKIFVTAYILTEL